MISLLDIGGKVVKQDRRYTVKDNTDLNNLVVSSTLLNPTESTTGHKHDGQEEVYFFLQGNGWMQLDSEVFAVSEGDVVQIHDGVFHRVFNATNESLYFICVFEGKRHN